MALVRSGKAEEFEYGVAADSSGAAAMSTGSGRKPPTPLGRKPAGESGGVAAAPSGAPSTPRPTTNPARVGAARRSRCRCSTWSRPLVATKSSCTRFRSPSAAAEEDRVSGCSASRAAPRPETRTDWPCGRLRTTSLNRPKAGCELREEPPPPASWTERLPNRRPRLLRPQRHRYGPRIHPRSSRRTASSEGPGGGGDGGGGCGTSVRAGGP